MGDSCERRGRGIIKLASRLCQNFKIFTNSLRDWSKWIHRHVLQQKTTYRSLRFFSTWTTELFFEFHLSKRRRTSNSQNKKITLTLKINYEYCISLQVKLIKFKNPIIDVLANSRSVVVTFNERIAIFDAFTLEDRLTVTTCFVSPGLNPNPIALGTRWMAYAENRFLPSKRSAGGNEGEGVQVRIILLRHKKKTKSFSRDVTI